MVDPSLGRGRQEGAGVQAEAGGGDGAVDMPGMIRQAARTRAGATMVRGRASLAGGLGGSSRGASDSTVDDATR